MLRELVGLKNAKVKSVKVKVYCYFITSQIIKFTKLFTQKEKQYFCICSPNAFLLGSPAGTPGTSLLTSAPNGKPLAMGRWYVHY